MRRVDVGAMEQLLRELQAIDAMLAQALREDDKRRRERIAELAGIKR